jgi:hypothetical protein
VPKATDLQRDAVTRQRTQCRQAVRQARLAPFSTGFGFIHLLFERFAAAVGPWHAAALALFARPPRLYSFRRFVFGFCLSPLCMRARLDLLRRNRRLVALFAFMALLPALVFAVLLVRAVRAERVRLDYEKALRQRQLVTLAEADLHNWLFSVAADGARARALVRFALHGEQIAFPDFGLSFPVSAPIRQRPFETSVADAPLTADAVAAQYYPRIQAFLRDQKAGSQGGAQHFLRLRALVVRPPDAPDGYVIDIDPVVQHLNDRLAQFCRAEPFTASAVIASTPARSAATQQSYPLAGFPFFEIVFADTPASSLTNVREHAVIALMTALVSVALLGSLFVYRAVRHESRLSELRNDFVAAVSHEFRSPLSSILMLAERLETERPVGQTWRPVGRFNAGTDLVVP